MVETGAGPNKIFRQVEKIQDRDIHHQSHVYYGIIGIGNVGNIALPDPLLVLSLQKLNGSTQQVQKFYDRVRSDMIAKEIQGSIKNTYLEKLSLHRGVYEWVDTGGIIKNDVTRMLNLIFKSMNSDTRTYVSNLKYEIDKATLATCGNSAKHIIHNMSSN